MLSGAFYKLVICAFIHEIYISEMLVLTNLCFEWSIPEIFVMKQLHIPKIDDTWGKNTCF